MPAAVPTNPLPLVDPPRRSTRERTAAKPFTMPKERQSAFRQGGPTKRERDPAVLPELATALVALVRDAPAAVTHEPAGPAPGSRPKEEPAEPTPKRRRIEAKPIIATKVNEPKGRGRKRELAKSREVAKSPEVAAIEVSMGWTLVPCSEERGPQCEVHEIKVNIMGPDQTRPWIKVKLVFGDWQGEVAGTSRLGRVALAGYAVTPQMVRDHNDALWRDRPTIVMVPL